MKPNQLFFTISIKIYDSLWHYEFLKIEWEQDVIQSHSDMSQQGIRRREKNLIVQAYKMRRGQKQDKNSGLLLGIPSHRTFSKIILITCLFLILEQPPCGNYHCYIIVIFLSTLKILFVPLFAHHVLLKKLGTWAV